MRELHLLKVALSQKVSHSPEHYPLKQKNCKGEYLAHFVETGAKVKNFLKLSHLYHTTILS